MPPVSRIRRRWRPSIALVVAGVCITLVSVPLLSLLAIRLTSNQFIRETEQTLIQQGTIYAALYAEAFAAQKGAPIGPVLDEDRRAFWAADLHPVPARLNLRHDPVQMPRPEGRAVPRPVDPRHAALVGDLIETARAALKTNLSGVAFLDHEGRLLNAPLAPSLADLSEVQAALAGDVGRAMRFRGKAFDPHSYASPSRDTAFRVFVTYPVIVENRVVGAIYLSRTPLNLGKFLYRERADILMMLGAMVLAAGGLGWVLTRLISRPAKGLRDAAMAVAEGRSDAAPVLAHYGLRELASLGVSVEAMAATLTRRAREITTYTDHVTHELKSPVTGILGAAELLQTEGLPEEDRAKLLDNIAQEGARMNALLGRLREITQVRMSTGGAGGRLAEMIPLVPGLDIRIETEPEAELPLTAEHGRMLVLHMAQNARAHHASRLSLTWDGQDLVLADNGEGIAAADLARVTEPFFTTRRDTGGTGMGLAICGAILDAYGATLQARPSDVGAVFVVSFPATTGGKGGG
ncbi:MAG: ATP-binding protein [Silicimonas sp.]|nr:ATP-binding protein [Silicimonas sp.]